MFTTAQQLKLQKKLTDILGSEHVYFQGPGSKMMVYPAIVYKLRDMRTQHADNAPYSQRKRYEVTVMDFDPDNVTKDAIAALPLCSFDRSFVNDNLNHFVFNLYW